MNDRKDLNNDDFIVKNQLLSDYSILTLLNNRLDVKLENTDQWSSSKIRKFQYSYTSKDYNNTLIKKYNHIINYLILTYNDSSITIKRYITEYDMNISDDLLK